MFVKIVISIVALLTTSVLPDPSVPRTKRLSRGPAWTNFQSLAVNADAIASASASKEGLHSVAVTTRTSDKSNRTDEVLAELVRSGLRYSDKLIVVDDATTESLFGDADSIPKIQALAITNDIDFVVVVAVSPGNAAGLLEIVSNVEVIKGGILLRTSLPKTPDEVASVAVQMRKSVLQHLGAMPSRNVDQLQRTPHASSAAIEHLVDAKRKLANLYQMKGEGQRKALCQAALGDAQLALNESPGFLEAFIVKASCLDELDDQEQLKQTLTLAIQKSDPPEHDLLTLLELRADHARFVETDPFKSLETYQSLLEANASNLTGMWAITDILLTGDGVSPPDQKSLTAAAEYAAKIIAFHPHSRVAQAIKQTSDAK